MPEGDSIFRAAAQIRSVLAGQQIHRLTHSEHLPQADQLAAATVTSVESRGKHLLIHFDCLQVLHTHLGMKGLWQVGPQGIRWRRPPWQMAVCLETTTHQAVCFRPSQLEILTVRQLRRQPWLRRLGPDLLSPDRNHEQIRQRFRSQGNLPVGEVVMNQSVVCGIGNIYKSEVLFLEQLHPQTPVHRLTDAQIDSLVERAANLLKRNTGAGPRQTRFRSTGPRAWVYERSGEPCLKCGSPIQITRQGDLGRSTYYCPECQQQDGQVATNTAAT